MLMELGRQQTHYEHICLNPCSNGMLMEQTKVS